MQLPGSRASILIPPPPRVYAVFISHAWNYDAEYDALVDLIRPDEKFLWENISVPKSSPLDVYPVLSKSYRYIVRQLDDEIGRAECLIVLAGMYAAHSGWIQSEIEAAKEKCVPIVAVKPRGSERIPEAATHAAVEVVGWNRRSIIDAISRLARPPLSVLARMVAQPPPTRLR